MANRSHSVKTSLDLVGERGREEEEKTKQKTEVICLASAENLPPIPHLVLGCTFPKFYSLQEVQMLSRSAWQQKCLERNCNCILLSVTGIDGARNAHETGENRCPYWEWGWYFAIWDEWQTQISKAQIYGGNSGKTLTFFPLWPCKADGQRHIWLLIYTGPNLRAASFLLPLLLWLLNTKFPHCKQNNIFREKFKRDLQWKKGANAQTRVLFIIVYSKHGLIHRPCTWQRYTSINCSSKGF